MVLTGDDTAKTQAKRPQGHMILEERMNDGQAERGRKIAELQAGAARYNKIGERIMIGV